MLTMLSRHDKYTLLCTYTNAYIRKCFMTFCVEKILLYFSCCYLAYSHICVWVYEYVHIHLCITFAYALFPVCQAVYSMCYPISFKNPKARHEIKYLDVIFLNCILSFPCMGIVLYCFSFNTCTLKSLVCALKLWSVRVLLCIRDKKFSVLKMFGCNKS